MAYTEVPEAPSLRETCTADGKEDTERTFLLTLSFWVRAATPLA